MCVLMGDQTKIALSVMSLSAITGSKLTAFR